MARHLWLKVHKVVRKLEIASKPRRNPLLIAQSRDLSRLDFHRLPGSLAARRNGDGILGSKLDYRSRPCNLITFPRRRKARRPGEGKQEQP